ncbi:hypothetical protein IP88_05205 [alpha proteobacterium AAP81b]|nr:hypothetical protein IP88_05205 [alpha proteobacterium AAP81b]
MTVKAAPSLDVPARWWREPALSGGEEVCVFVTVAPGARIAPHNLFHARAWAAAGFRTIVVLIGDDITAEPDPDEIDFAAGVLLRANLGYDFGAWAAVLALCPALADAGLLALANDSVIGPMRSFPAFLGRARAAPSDYIGVTLSHELCSHFQSYMQFFRPGALRHAAFQRFWHGVETGDRQFVIANYELALLTRMLDAGLTAQPLFGLPPHILCNPTIHLWRDLIAAGFPFIKMQLLRDNPTGLDLTGWRDLLAAGGYDPALAEAHLRSLRHAAALRFG